jgi:hypothetical protein
MVSSLGRRLRRVVVAAAMSVGLVAAVATPAHARWLFFDNFENNPAATWWFEGTGHFSNTNGIAHSGQYYADFTLTAPGWASVDHSLQLPQPILFLNRTCTASAWFSGLGPGQVRIEVINPVNWTYVTLGTWNLTGVYQWQQNSISWSGGPNNVVLRLTILNNDGSAVRTKTDDPAVSCSP